MFDQEVRKLNRVENRCINYLLTLPLPKENCTYDISTTLYKEFYKISEHDALVEIKKACEFLFQKPYFEVNGKSELKTTNIVRMKITDTDNLHKEVLIQFTKVFFEKVIMKKMTELHKKNSLTPNQKSLYNYLLPHLNSSSIRVSPDTLVNRLNLAKTYEIYSQLKRGFITPSLKAIEKKRGIKITYTESFELIGKKYNIAYLTFTVKKS